jgi:hypothetical protein
MARNDFQGMEEEVQQLFMDIKSCHPQVEGYPVPFKSVVELVCPDTRLTHAVRKMKESLAENEYKCVEGSKDGLTPVEYYLTEDAFKAYLLACGDIGRWVRRYYISLEMLDSETDEVKAVISEAEARGILAQLMVSRKKDELSRIETAVVEAETVARDAEKTVIEKRTQLEEAVVNLSQAEASQIVAQRISSELKDKLKGLTLKAQALCNNQSGKYVKLIHIYQPSRQ